MRNCFNTSNDRRQNEQSDGHFFIMQPLLGTILSHTLDSIHRNWWDFFELIHDNKPVRCGGHSEGRAPWQQLKTDVSATNRPCLTGKRHIQYKRLLKWCIVMLNLSLMTPGASFLHNESPLCLQLAVVQKEQSDLHSPPLCSDFHVALFFAIFTKTCGGAVVNLARFWGKS